MNGIAAVSRAAAVLRGVPVRLERRYRDPPAGVVEEARLGTDPNRANEEKSVVSRKAGSR